MVRQSDPSQPLVGAPPRVDLRYTSGTETERDVLHGAQVGEQQVVLEHEANRPLFDWHEHVGGGVVEHEVVDADTAPFDGHETRQGPQHGRLA